MVSALIELLMVYLGVLDKSYINLTALPVCLMSHSESLMGTRDGKMYKAVGPQACIPVGGTDT